jgi:hypothetical protein
MPTANVQRNDYYEAGPSQSTLDDARRTNFPRFNAALTAVNERKWEVAAVRTLVRLAQLPAGWDSYGAPMVRRDAGHFALEILDGVMRSMTPPPQIVPSATGGVQLEWHEKGIDLEIHVIAPYQWELWFQDHRDPNSGPVSLELTDDLSELKRPIALLTSRP